MAFKLWGAFPSRKKVIHETEPYLELSFDDVRRAKKCAKEIILITEDVEETSEDPSREEDDSI